MTPLPPSPIWKKKMDNNASETMPALHKDRYGFENAAIRMFRLQKQDLQPLINIRNDPEARKRLDGLDEMTDRDLLDWAVESDDSKRRELMISVDNLVGEPAGFVYLYRQHWTRQHRLIDENIAEPPPGNTLDLEISVGRNPANRQIGLISSGIRQACLKMREIMFDQGHTPQNPGLRITAYIEPDNSDSVRAFESAGFTLRGNMLYTKDSAAKDRVYILDWSKLDEQFHGKSAANSGAEFIRTARNS
jgi:RimJ/RimL family protein N-acetyltransferase